MVTNLIAIVEGNTNAKLVDSKLKEKWSRQLGRRGSLRQFVQHSLSGKMNLKWIEGKSPLIRLLHLKKKIISSHILLRSKLLFLNSLERWNIEERISNECRKEQMKNRMKREKTRATKSQLVSL